MARKRSTGFAARLQALRVAAGLTQAQLAEKAGMHLGGLTKLEQGLREPSWPVVLDLARALQVSVEAFMDGQPEETTTEEEKPKRRGRPRKDQGEEKGGA
jgi:transcriptional regulator with XRE-family HTH domain